MDGKVIERIRKLLARTTQRGATEAEAAAAIMAAQRLMAEHGVSLVDLESSGFGSVEWTHQPAWEVDGLGDVETPYVAPIVSQAFNVRLFDEYNRTGGIRTETRIFGEPVNVEVACWAFRYLHGTFKDLWIAYRLGTKCHHGKKRAYYYGLALGMQSKLERARREAEVAAGADAGDGKGLVLAYQAKLNAAYEECVGPSSREKKPGMGSDRNVAFDGREAGKCINLSRPIAEREIRSITSGGRRP